MNQIYFLFKSVLNSFSIKSKDLLISFKNPIRVKLSYLLNIDIDFQLEDDQFIIAIIESVSKNKNEVQQLYEINSLILHIDYIFDYLNKYRNEVIEASVETKEMYPDHLEDWSYWLTNWNPNIINKETFDRGYVESFELWKKETILLRKAILDATMMPPYYCTSDYWDILEGKINPSNDYMEKIDK